MPDFAKQAATAAVNSKELQDAYRQKREREADAAGLKGQFRDQYVNTIRKNTYQDTFWDRFKEFFGGKRGSKAFQESLDLEDSAYLSELMNAQREQEYNDPAAQAERMRTAGINPDLTGGESLTPGEASQIDDEVLGSGLSAVLTETQSQAAQMPLQLANGIMEAAGSVMSLVSGGMGISNSLFQMDLDEVSKVFDLTKQGLDLGAFIPTLGVKYDDVRGAYYDDNGELTVENLSERAKAKLVEDQRYRHPRTRRMMRQLIDTMYSPQAFSKHLESKAAEKRAAKSYAQEGIGLAELTGDFNPNVEDLLRNPGYRETIDLSVELYKLQLESRKKMAEIEKAYRDAFMETDENNPNNGSQMQAARDRMTAEVEAYQADLQRQVYDMMETWLSNRSNSDSPVDKLLLLSIMSGGFRELGFDSPMQLPGDILTRLGNLADFVTDLIPGLGQTKAISKGVASFAGDSSVDADARVIAKKAAAAAGK